MKAEKKPLHNYSTVLTASGVHYIPSLMIPEMLVPLLDKDSDGELGGIFFCKGRTWKELRKFTMRHLGDLGIGKRDAMEASILEVGW